MSFDRQDILTGLFDNIIAPEDTTFESLKGKIVSEQSSRGILRSTMTLSLVASALQQQIEKQSLAFPEALKRALGNAKIENYEEVEDFVLAEFNDRSDRSIQKAKGILLGLSIITGFADILKNIERRFEGIKERTVPELKLAVAELEGARAIHLALQPGDVFTANRALRALIKPASISLDIIDNYFGPEVLDMLEVTAISVRIRLLSGKKASAATENAYRAFKTQYGRIEFKVLIPAPFHDRFILIDAKRCITIGHSLKDLGTKQSVINEMPLGTQLTEFNKYWIQATPI